MRTLQDAVAVVTGAGSGIGRALALELARGGASLALADVDETGLAETQAAIGDRVKIMTRRVDVSKPDEMAAFREAVEAEFGRCSLLVNNAGVALYGRFEDVSQDDLAWIMGINFWGAVYGCREFLPLLRREPAANVVTISSVFGLIAPPLQSGYCASKFAVRGFSEVLRHELAYSNVRVTVVHPGGIKTKIAANTRRGARADEASWKRDTKGFERSLVTPPAVAATKIVHAVLHDRPRLLIGNDAFLIDMVQRFWAAQYAKILAPVLDPKGNLAALLARNPEHEP
ncbi:MAG: SDR family NAD(P)-dependent oxidoreductase [Candidatus Eremiobacteraeota bacterium]|nr:SDR family NAD(P)-dependent oxidoreductase [Candidatus Eremiobacteraeota bacterium]